MSEATDESIYRRSQSGASQRQIAEELGVSRRQVLIRLRRRQENAVAEGTLSAALVRPDWPAVGNGILTTGGFH